MRKAIEFSDVPTIDEFKELTIRVMRLGVTNSYRMREVIAAERNLEIVERTSGNWDETPSGRFTNNHAFSLVALQQDRLIEKTGEHEYRLLT
jgi:hypothetical protein